MANVPTDEREAVVSEEVTSGAIRAAILERIPNEPHITRDVRIHDGIADISLRWRTLRFAISMGFQQMTPEEVATSIEASFKAWVANTIKNMNETHRHSLAISEMSQWLADNPPENSPLLSPNKTAYESEAA